MQSLSFNVEIENLLVSANLLADDLDGNNNVRLFGVVTEKCLVGLVGIEGVGDAMLLRSLVVSESARNQGLGRSWVVPGSSTQNGRRVSLVLNALIY